MSPKEALAAPLPLLRELRAELAGEPRLGLVAVVSPERQEVLAAASRTEKAAEEAAEILGMALDAAINAETLEWLYARALELPSPELSFFREVVVHGQGGISVFLAPGTAEVALVATLSPGVNLGLALSDLRDLQRRLAAAGAREAL